MAEPISTAGATAFFKIYGMAIVVILSTALIALVVMMIRMPKNPQEWAVGLICTVVSSITGGSFFIMKFGLHEWVNNVWGVLALGGFFFACGLPGWFIVRITTNFINQRESKNIVEVVKELKKEMKGE
ncbi:TPA: hypothetical protein ACV20N_000427 [Acinetobacter baumannii]|uniref:hypothetical protein n=1 Tax=Acinetobacter baumannii TaxID=470 RepID=UPI0023410CAB|nr:hypothetical protein [Acinetobacter baumannii]MDC4405102.1 hypothetical protein [Acinetobacter baumannii]